MVWHVPVPLPSAINHDEFMNIIFWDGERNIRWRRGTEITVYFDYEGAPNMAPADRLAAEAQALREMQAWLDPQAPWARTCAGEARYTIRIRPT